MHKTKVPTALIKKPLENGITGWWDYTSYLYVLTVITDLLQNNFTGSQKADMEFCGLELTS